MTFILFFIVIILQLPMGWLMANVSLPLGIILNQLGVMLAVPIVLIKLFSKKVPGTFYFSSGVEKKSSLSPFCMFIAIIAALSVAILTDYSLAATEYIIHPPARLHEGMERLMAAVNMKEYFTKVLLLAVLPAFCEEVFFRGICQKRLVARYGKWAGILIASLLFSTAHMNPWYIHLYFMLGAFLGWMYEKSGSLWLPIICHFINNWWTVTTNYYDIRIPLGQLFFDIVLATCTLFVLVQSMRLTTSESGRRFGGTGDSAA